MIKQNYRLVGIAVVALLFSGASYAATVAPTLSGSVAITNGGSTTWSFPDGATYTPNPDGTFTYVGTKPASSLWSFDWNITVDPDPLINATLGITNNSSITKHFDILFTLGVGSPFALGTMNGSMSASFQDFNNNGLVSLTNVNWSGRVDGADVMSLSTYDVTCGPGSPGCTGSLGTVSDGPLPFGAVNSNIGLRLSFDLSAGDRATFTNYFEVIPVPLPAALWLFGAGLGVLTAFARKKK
jgi:hypothetical protein